MKVAVVVPCRDRIDSLRRCLDSIARSISIARDRHGPACAVETFVVDDHSAAGFRSVLASRHPRVTILDVEGEGPGAARNTALRRSDAELYLLTDSDCIVAEDWCNHAIEWHGERRGPMGQGVPWLYQGAQNFVLGKQEEELYRHMFSRYIADGCTTMIDPRCLMLSREYFTVFPREVFASWIPDASAEDRSIIGALIAQGLRIDWCPQVRVFHEDPLCANCVWQQKYRHGRGRVHLWHEPPPPSYLLDRYFLGPIAAGVDPAYVVPAHIAFLLGYRDARRRHRPPEECAWWEEMRPRLAASVPRAEDWFVTVEAALSALAASAHPHRAQEAEQPGRAQGASPSPRP